MKVEDRELIKLIKRDPEKGLEEAMILYAPLVKAILIKIIGNEQERDLQECLSDVFVRLWRFVDGFDENKGTLKGYIASIARNEALRRLKQTSKYHEAVTLGEMELGLEMDMVGEVSRTMNKDIIQQVVDELEDPDRQIFIKRFFWGDSIKGIGEELKLAPKFVENRLYLAKKKLKSRLLERGIIL